MATRLQEITEQIAAKSRELHLIFEAAGPDYDMAKVTSLDGDSAAKAAEIKRRNDELTALGIERDGLAELAGMAQKAADANTFYNKPAGGFTFPNGGKAHDANGGHAEGGKSLAQLFAESKAFEAVRNGHERSGRVSLSAEQAKTLITLTTISPQTSGSACSR
jgi:hypothetical protein